MSKTMAEQMDEARVAWRAAWIALGEALVVTRPFRAIARFADWTDKRFPQLSWIDQHAPRWLLFGSREFFAMVGNVYLIITAGLLLVWGIQWLSTR